MAAFNPSQDAAVLRKAMKVRAQACAARREAQVALLFRDPDPTSRAHPRKRQAQRARICNRLWQQAWGAHWGLMGGCRGGDRRMRRTRGRRRPIQTQGLGTDDKSLVNVVVARSNEELQVRGVLVDFRPTAHRRRTLTSY